MHHRRGQHVYHPVHVKLLVRRGQALMGLQCWRAALHAFEEAARLDPDNAEAKAGMESAERLLLKDVLEGACCCSLRLEHDQRLFWASSPWPSLWWCVQVTTWSAAHCQRLMQTCASPTCLTQRRCTASGAGLRT